GAGRSRWEGRPRRGEWGVGRQGFGGRRHLRAAESGLSRAKARALLDEWITLSSTGDPVVGRPDVAARRIISWLTQAPLVLDESDVRFYRRFMRSLTRQVRRLRHMVAEARDGVPRLQAGVALTYAALCPEGQAPPIPA